MSSNDVVATSINPFARLDHQLRCVRKWQSLGYRIVAFQNASEAELLRREGLLEVVIHVVSPDQTATELHGRPIPRILPVLETLRSTYPTDNVLLVNSDIYPGLRSKAEKLSTLYDCAAMTRMDVLSLSPVALKRAKSYRGGLDVFFFSAEALSGIIDSLALHPVAERMTFGIPGWDYFLSGMIINTVPRYAILDGEDFYHVVHPQTYSDMGELSHYLHHLAEWNLVDSDDPHIAANQFSIAIGELCNVSSQASQLISLLYKDLSFQRTGANLGNSRIPANAEEVLLDFAHSENYHTPAALDFYCDGCPKPVQFQKGLECLKVLISAIFDEEGKSFGYDYPKTAMHKVAIKNVMTSKDLYYLRLRILELFTADLTHFQIFNRALLTYLALACENDVERDLVASITNNLEKVKNAATS